MAPDRVDDQRTFDWLLHLRLATCPGKEKQRRTTMSDQKPILVTGAAGKVGAVGRTVVERLRQHNLPVRALVRRHDERAEALSGMGAEVVVGDLTHAGDVAHALEGCRRMYFGMSVSLPTSKQRSLQRQRHASAATSRHSSTSR